MSVNLSASITSPLLPVDGVSLGVSSANIKTPNRQDVMVMQLEENACVSGVFTQNRFCAAPVTICKQHLSKTTGIRASLVNTGYANAGTGESGFNHAMQSCDALAALLNIQPNQVLPFSTGVILEPLPIEKLIKGLPPAIKNLKADNWHHAAEAIMTTDIVPKGTSRQLVIDGKKITITGVSKGSGMIHPNMATMLSYIATDAVISQSALDMIMHYAVNKSFNCITVDGDTSTNDSFIMVATHKANNSEVTEESASFIALRDAVTEVAVELAQAIVRDGEGATKFITVQVEAGEDEAECRKVAYAIARSPLVKTAFFASDPNLGRILAAIGYADIDDLDVNNITLYLGDMLVSENGELAKNYQEAKAAAVMVESEISVRVVLNRGQASTTVWTCDFSYDYVKINAEYRS